jgi:prepilin-type N-terminal cleavage/methylation domain-containing protein
VRRGFTLIEVLLAAVLGLLLLGLMVSTLVPIMKYSAWGYSRAELLQAASLVSTRLTTDLQKAPKAGIYLPDPATAQHALLSIRGISEVTDSGLPVYDPQLICYDWEATSASLTRKLWPPGQALESQAIPLPLDRPTCLGPTDVRTVMNQVNGTEHRLASGILTKFALTPASAQITWPLHLSMTFKLQVPGRVAETYLHEADIYSRTGQ